MAPPPLADRAAFEARLGRALTGVDATRAEAAISDASALARDAAGATWVDESNELTDVPEAVVAVVLMAARRAFDNPEGYAQFATGSESFTYRGSSGVYLTGAEQQICRRAAGSVRLFDSLEIVRGNGTSTLWVGTQDADADLVPFETIPLS